MLINSRKSEAGCVVGTLLALLLCAVDARATNVHVVPPDTIGTAPDGVFTTWATAATNIQDAVNAINTNGGNIVYISNGIYRVTNELVVSKGVVLRSWNGGVTDRDGTVIDADNYAGKFVTNRCLNASHAAVVLDGLTFQGGRRADAARGGGIYASAGIVVTNCAIISNEVSTAAYGGGFNFNGAGNVLITDSLIANNTAGQGGGGMIFNNNANVLITRCQIVSNAQTSESGDLGGGGVYLSWNNVISNCLIAFNRAGSCGGGVFIRGGILLDSHVVSNEQVNGSTQRGGSGLAFYNAGGVVRNCLIARNINLETTRPGAIYFNNTTGVVENCTIVSNTAGVKFRDAGSGHGVVLNSIVYDNVVTSTYVEAGAATYTNCCITITNNTAGSGNFTNNPAFAGAAAGDFRLTADSPCVNAGWNLPWMDSALDLDGRRRVDWINRRVDLGCYEYMPNGTMYQVR